MRAYAALTLATFFLAACHPDKAPMTAFVPDPELKSDLAKAAGLRVFFAHQSVGGNIVEGLQELRSLAGDTALHVIHDPAAPALPPAFFAEARLGQNGDPVGKLAAFRRVVDTTLTGRLDVALVKICFVDLGGDSATDPDSLFAAYHRTVMDLEAAHPGLRVIPVTSPLTVPNYGARGRMDLLKGTLKMWLGRPDDNARRAIFNQRLRAAFPDRAIFDLANIESTRPDGSRVRYGRAEAMAPEYTTDGGHLNAFWRKVAARALLRILAGAPNPRNANLP